jgi:hypothetical protein
MIEPEHPELSIVRQCELVSISRSGFYYRPAGETPLNLTLMRLIDAQFLERPGMVHARWRVTFDAKATRSGANECGG